MLADAFASIALAFSDAFEGPFGPAVIHSPGTPVMDDGGSIATPGTPDARDCQAQVDRAGEAMRQQDGFTEGDMAIIVLAATLTGGITTDDRIEIMAGAFAGMWSIEAVARDTVAAGFELRGRRV